MAIKTIIMTETFAEKETRLRRESATRMRILAVVAVVTVIARILIKDPVRPDRPDHSRDAIKIMPGMLASLPPSERAKMDPMIIAKMMAADEEAKANRARQAQPARPQPVETVYKPATRPEQNDVAGEIEKRQAFAVARRQKAEDLARSAYQQKLDAPKKALVKLSNGRWLRVEDARPAPGGYTLRLAGVSLTVPGHMIALVDSNPKDWEEPVPEGMVRLQPAHGIIITVGKDAARRITVNKPGYDQI